VLADGSCGRYLRHTGQGRISCGLRELCLYYSNRLSFAEVGKLLERLSGERLLCKQTLCNWVRQKAGELSAALRSEVAATEELAIPAFSEKADIYDEKAEEVLVMTDAIQVKAQKGTHQSSEGRASCVDGQKHNKKVKRISTEMMLLESRDGSFRHLCGGLDETVNLQELARSHLRREWVQHSGPLPMVAITDGARSLRLMLEELFGASVRVILDWYHLAKRTYQLLSMVAYSSKQREQIQKRVLSLLWRGNVGQALSFLGGVEARRQKALEELVGYLQKHASEIIDYERRAKAGKAIGSGRMEKALDRAVGARQKRKGISWSEGGSGALSLLKVVELNGEWDELWTEAA
jgi:hypothetical protein